MDEDTISKIISIAVFLGIIAGMIAAAVILRQGPVKKNNTITYNNFEFIRTPQNLWGTIWHNTQDNQDRELQFRYLPNETVDVPMTGQIEQSFFENEIYVTFDPANGSLQNLTIAITDLSLNLARGLNYNLVAACTTNATGCENRPIVTCEKNVSIPIIYLSHKSPTQITLNGLCITIQGEGKELIRSVDKLLFVWYGIIPTEKS